MAYPEAPELLDLAKVILDEDPLDVEAAYNRLLGLTSDVGTAQFLRQKVAERRGLESALIARGVETGGFGDRKRAEQRLGHLFETELTRRNKQQVGGGGGGGMREPTPLRGPLGEPTGGRPTGPRPNQVTLTSGPTDPSLASSMPDELRAVQRGLGAAARAEKEFRESTQGARAGWPGSGVVSHPGETPGMQRTRDAAHGFSAYPSFRYLGMPTPQEAFDAEVTSPGALARMNSMEVGRQALSIWTQGELSRRTTDRQNLIRRNQLQESLRAAKETFTQQERQEEFDLAQLEEQGIDITQDPDRLKALEQSRANRQNRARAYEDFLRRQEEEIAKADAMAAAKHREAERKVKERIALLDDKRILSKYPKGSAVAVQSHVDGIYRRLGRHFGVEGEHGKLKLAYDPRQAQEALSRLEAGESPEVLYAEAIARRQPRVQAAPPSQETTFRGRDPITNENFGWQWKSGEGYVKVPRGA